MLYFIVINYWGKYLGIVITFCILVHTKIFKMVTHLEDRLDSELLVGLWGRGTIDINKQVLHNWRKPTKKMKRGTSEHKGEKMGRL